MKKREKWGNISASLDSQNAREKDTKPFPASDSWDNAWKSREKNSKAKRRNHNVQGVPHTERKSSAPGHFPTDHAAAACFKDEIKLSLCLQATWCYWLHSWTFPTSEFGLKGPLFLQQRWSLFPTGRNWLFYPYWAHPKFL